MLVPSQLAADKVDRKSTRLNSSHLVISYAVFCLKKKTRHRHRGGSSEGPRPETTRRWRNGHRFFFFLRIRRPPRSPPFPYTTLFQSVLGMRCSWNSHAPWSVWGFDGHCWFT